MDSTMASFKKLGLASHNPLRSTGTRFTRSVACCTTRPTKTMSKLYFGSARHAVVCRALDQKETEVETEVTELTISNPETKKTTGTNFELELERFLFNTRYLAFIGVVGSLAGTTLMMCNGVIVMGSAIVMQAEVGVIVMGSAIMMQTNSVMSGGHAEVGVIVMGSAIMMQTNSVMSGGHAEVGVIVMGSAIMMQTNSVMSGGHAEVGVIVMGSAIMMQTNSVMSGGHAEVGVIVMGSAIMMQTNSVMSGGHAEVGVIVMGSAIMMQTNSVMSGGHAEVGVIVMGSAIMMQTNSVMSGGHAEVGVIVMGSAIMMQTNSVMSGGHAEVGVIVMGSAIMMQTNSVMSGGHAEVGGYVVAAIDDFVLGVVLLVFGLGMYELFISEIDQEAMGNGTDLSLGKRPEWLQTKGLDDLKKKLAKVIIMSLLVKTLGFFESVEVSGSTELLQAATAVTLCSIAMYFAGLGKQDPITK
eukprot:CAMPEP_0114269556 /NCGR_PEP_ID=MMETSP0058-20121206/26696_1 /TAXON_ID=36894 /ORGANISM="Pyramimonas parkeae, CCMP726" /LENGTH=468 /DNA_ID=CAMNT_0001388091 /DNA_START=568 /DNA_END=1975 /DNA_ORIENTATION=+